MMRSPSAVLCWRQTDEATATVGARMPLLRRLDRRGYAAALACELVVLFLPLGRAVRGRDLDRRHLVFRAVGGPVGILGGDDVDLGVRVVERRIDDARCHALRNQRAQRGLAGAARELDPIAIVDAALLGVVRMDFQPVFLVPHDVGGAAGLRADIILAENAAGGEQEREARAALFVG